MCELATKAVMATKAVNTDTERKLAAIPSKSLHGMSRNEYDIDTQYDTTLERHNVINGFVSHSDDTTLERHNVINGFVSPSMIQHSNDITL
ncbi:hypothetical protein DPMN_169887 [Dreissena polymorpha]|uniref:Uncharacterized protein n=1 Tax=Dreissena polymorpha TaxID=45954 RepID=A0A9D4IDR9_DREPO|nr:hypothetical protein DPMN_169887 [Dreissena polymorpha]